MTDIRDVSVETLRGAFHTAIDLANMKLDRLIREVYEADSHEEVWTSTVERTKGLDRIVSLCFERGFNAHQIDLQFTDANGFDFLHFDQKIEHKNATSDGNCWTGNKYGDESKVDFFLLTRMLLTGTQISGMFAAFVNLSECSANTVWVKSNSEKAAFSTLNVAIEDKENVFPVIGSFIKKPRARRFLHPILENV